MTNNGNSLTAVKADCVFTAPDRGAALTIISLPDGKLPADKVGVAYFQALVVCGRTPEYTW